MSDDQWYWSLKDKRAVQADERGQPHETLGPYATREAAENWAATNEARNDKWDDDDRKWEGDDDADSDVV